MVRLSHTPFVKTEDYNTLKQLDVSHLTEKIVKEHHYEFLLTDKTKLFFDYDEKSSNHDYIIEKRELIKKRLIEHSSKEKFVFTETDQPDKVSFHVIFKNKYIIRASFLPIDEEELFSKIVGTENFKNIDTSVYGKKTCFRLPYGNDNIKPFPHRPYGEVVNIADYVLSASDDVETTIYVSQLERSEKTQIEQDVEYTDNSKIIDILKLIHPERFKSFNKWLALMVVCKTHQIPIELFLEISEASGYEKFDDISCRKAWRSCRPSQSFGLSTVIGWAKQDNIDIESFFPRKSPILDELLNGLFAQGDFTHFNVATALYNHYKDNLIYTQQGWFHYNDKWVVGDKSLIFHPIMKILSSDLSEYIKTFKIDPEMIMRDNDNEEEEKESNKAKKALKIKIKLQKSANQLQNSSFVKGVLETAQGLFHNDKALDTFDKHPEWFCFKNQVAYNLKTKEFMKIEAKDRILTTCGYNFPERNQNDIDKVMALIKTIMPEENVKSLLSALCIFLYGGNVNELFIVFRGEGRNGKGLIISLLKIVLGDYFYSLPTEVLTDQSKGANRPKPELAQCKWARCVMASEPDERAKMVKTTLNLLTGNDEMTVRQLNKEPFSFVPSFTLGMMCNDTPNVSGGINEAIGKRMKFQVFPYTFVEHPQSDNQKQVDTSLKEKIKDASWRNGLLFILLDTYFETKGKYITCDDSKEEEKTYAKQNNPLTSFLENYEESKEFIRINVLKQAYGGEMTTAKFKVFLEQAGMRIQEDKSHGHKVFLKEKELII
jgi:phage/plasmid-associated DNA primase